MQTIRFVALNTDLVEQYQSGQSDANQQTPERHTSKGDGIPCRHCLQRVKSGEDYLILAHRPFSAKQPYAELGPIFLHAEPCERWSGNDSADPKLPPMLTNPKYIMRGYDDRDRIIYATGQIIETEKIFETAQALLQQPKVKYLHLRSATANCYQCRIELGH